jgi:HAD superfamily hydrolase (TIGR01509 family)
MVSELGIPCTRDEFYLYEGMTGAATLNLIFRRHYGHEATSEQIKELYHLKTLYFREYGDKEEMPGADRMLGELMKAGIARVLVTGSGQNSLLDKINEDYPGAFPDGMRVTAHDVVHGKPDPEPYLKGLEKAGTSCRNTIVIENAPLGVKAGHSAGCFTIAVTTGPIPRKEMIEAGADLVFPSMPEFADNLPKFIKLFNLP